jgi:hypothetical protein
MDEGTPGMVLANKARRILVAAIHPEWTRDLARRLHRNLPIGTVAMPGDEEIPMSDTPHLEPPPGMKRHYSRPDPEMTDEEIDEWA